MANIVNFGLGHGNEATGGLDITVVGGTTQPENPKENTVWVNTDVSIGAVYLAPNAPQSPQVGDVWVNTTNKYNFNGTNASTNILRVSDNPYLEINVLNISQWDGTKWVTRENSAIYANGAWTNMALYMLNQGVIREGFEIIGRHNNDQTSNVDLRSTAAVNYNSGYAYIALGSSVSGNYIGMQFQPMIDVTNYTKLQVSGKTYNSYMDSGHDYRNVYVGFSSAPIGTTGADNIEDLTAQGQASTGRNDGGSTRTFNLTANLANVSGEKYLGVGAYFLRDEKKCELYIQTVILTA